MWAIALEGVAWGGRAGSWSGASGAWPSGRLGLKRQTGSPSMPAAVLVMAREKAEALGLEVLGTLRSYAVVGVPADIMGIGPAKAIPKAVAKAGISVGDVDLFEINEAFASQALYCLRELGLDGDKVNVNGGAIALGHPIGASGCRVLVTLLHEMVKRDAKKGIASLCIGGGMGVALTVER